MSRRSVQIAIRIPYCCVLNLKVPLVTRDPVRVFSIPSSWSDIVMLKELFQIIESRKSEMPEESYTARLIDAGQDEILKKVGEETMEVLLAAKGQGDQRLVEEMADLFYHMLVLLAAHDLSLADVEAELERRHQGLS
jgi:phosphoribosyl-ATP pyrophosphohydrolase